MLKFVSNCRVSLFYPRCSSNIQLKEFFREAPLMHWWGDLWSIWCAFAFHNGRVVLSQPGLEPGQSGTKTADLTVIDRNRYCCCYRTLCCCSRDGQVYPRPFWQVLVSVTVLLINRLGVSCLCSVIMDWCDGGSLCIISAVISTPPLITRCSFN